MIGSNGGLTAAESAALTAWVAAGGTLIAVGDNDSRNKLDTYILPYEIDADDSGKTGVNGFGWPGHPLTSGVTWAHNGGSSTCGTPASYSNYGPGHPGTNGVPALSSTFTLPAAGALLPASVPSDSSLCGLPVYMQVIEADAGASAGVSFSRGLIATLGS